MPITAIDRLGDEDDIAYISEIALDSGTSIVPTHEGDIRYNTSLGKFQALDSVGVFNLRSEDVLMYVKYIGSTPVDFYELGQVVGDKIEKLV